MSTPKKKELRSAERRQSERRVNPRIPLGPSFDRRKGNLASWVYGRRGASNRRSG